MPRWSKILIGVVVGIGVLIGGFFLADGIVRGVIEDRVADEVVQGLPAEVDGDFAVTVGGVSVIAQYLSGRFDHVELRDDDVNLNGTAAAVTLVARGIPTDRTQPVEQVNGTIVIDQTAVNQVWESSGQGAPGTSLTLESGAVAYDGAFSLFGVSVGYRVSATPEAAGDRVLLFPTDAALTGAAGSLDLSGLLDTVLQGEPIEICVAEYLPVGIDLTGVSVAPDAVTIELAAAQLVLSEGSLKQTGSCAP